MIIEIISLKRTNIFQLGHFLISLLKTLSHFFHKNLKKLKISIDKKIKNIYTVHDGLWEVIDRLTKELIDRTPQNDEVRE